MLTTFKPEIVLLSGRLCSGKGHYCDSMRNQYDHLSVISVSSIVRQLVSTRNVDRKTLQDTAHLDQQIVHELTKQIDQTLSFGLTPVVEGIRQLCIIEAITDHYNHNTGIRLVWLHVPIDELERRYNKRQDSRDQCQTFKSAYDRDELLGVGDVERYIRDNNGIVINH